jgi:prenyltransferase beta subunit
MHNLIAAVVLLVPVAALSAQTPEQKRTTVKFLQDLQVGDGGFVPAPIDSRLDQNPHGSLRATSSALRALNYFGGMAKEKAAAANFVKSCWDSQSGSFMDAPGGKGDVFTTAIGLMAVQELRLPMDSYRNAAVAYMGEHANGFEEYRIAAAGMEAAGKISPVAERWLGTLKAKANSDGSFGNGTETARATGGTVVAILRLGGTAMNPKELIAILDRGQSSDGGFLKDGNDSSDLDSSYRVTRCYHMLKAKPARAEALREFIAKCRNSDGGYGLQPGKPSQVGPTYNAGSILHWLDE